jgi:hypothetical protein
MAADYRDTVRTLIARSQAMDSGLPQVMIAEEAVRLADSHGDVDLGFEARAWLIESATFSGEDAHMFAPFAWCLAQLDRNPKRFPANDLLWQYKWVVGHAVGSGQFSVADVTAMIDDMERRYRAAGLSLYSPCNARLELARRQGKTDEVRERFRKLRSMRRDRSSDCAACVCDSDIVNWVFLGDDRRALEAARPILGGELRCGKNIPRVSLARVLLPMFRLGHLEDARECHLKWHRIAARQRGVRLIHEAYDNVLFLTLTENHTRAVHVLENHFPYPIGPLDLDRSASFFFFLAARFLMERLGNSGRKTVRLRLDASFPAHRDGGTYDIPALQSWFEREARRIATAFDAESGTESFHHQVARHLDLAEQVRPYPMNGRRSGRSSGKDD